MGMTTPPHLKAVHLGPPKGRGVITQQDIAKGDFVCEYRTYKVYQANSSEEKRLAEEYKLNGEGSFVVYTAYPTASERLCFDATRRYRDVARLINHSPKPNLRLFKPLHLWGKWRIGLYAGVDIVKGSELTFDYGVREKKWMKVRAMTTVSCGEVGKGQGEGVTGDGGEGGKSLPEGDAMECNLGEDGGLVDTEGEVEGDDGVLEGGTMKGDATGDGRWGAQKRCLGAG